MPEERIQKLIMEWIPMERRKRGRPKKNMDGRSKSSHDNKKFRTRSMEKQRGMAIGFRKTATAVIKPDRQISHTSIFSKEKSVGHNMCFDFLNKFV
jgi:Tfp pilus assembly pilus retraction ATPase PilT